MGEAARRDNTRVGLAIVALFVGLFSFAALESVARIVVGPSSTIAALIGVLIIVVALWRQASARKAWTWGGLALAGVTARFAATLSATEPEVVDTSFWVAAAVGVAFWLGVSWWVWSHERKAVAPKS